MSDSFVSLVIRQRGQSGGATSKPPPTETNPAAEALAERAAEPQPDSRMRSVEAGGGAAAATLVAGCAELGSSYGLAGPRSIPVPHGDTQMLMLL